MQDALANLLSPPVLFFFLGLGAALAKSDLEFPARVAKALALYLLLAIGYSGGVELAAEGFTQTAVTILLSALLLAFLLPLGVYFFLHRNFGRADAAAIAATYGSVSAVTFIAAMAFLQKLNIPFSGAMIAAMALMESPAILVGLWLAKGRGLPWKLLLREAVLNGSVVLLLGSLFIGMLSAPAAVESLKPFVKGIFPGLLCLFLLDMGLLCGKRFGDLWRAGARAVVPALVFPPIHATLAIGLAWLLNFSQGDALLLAVLAGSASYIAVPAAMRVALPEANPGIYVPMALAVTFPFNIIVGIPLYLTLINFLWTT
jgi:hypothetical protein